MKGIILAGGSGTRLHPLTLSVSKQLLPIYDKPMIYYPLSILMLGGIKDVLIISTPHDLPNFIKLFGNGKQFGIKISYNEQPSPDGLAQAFTIGKKFINNEDVCLILGDNIFYGSGLQQKLKQSIDFVKNEKKAMIYSTYVSDPKRYGVAEFDCDNNVISIEEKPHKPKSNYAIVGIYFYPNSVIEIAKNIKPSKRGEVEITSVNNEYLKRNELKLDILSRGYAWLDTGTHEALCEATEFVKSIEKRTNLKIGCLEEIALNYKWISKATLKKNISGFKGDYYAYLSKIVN